MVKDVDYGDLPIGTPEQDLFGIDPFVKALARSIKGMRTPQGVVIALNGPWGSGKSSAMNLLQHHLKDARDHGDIEVVNFNPWWFRGEEALVLAFFRELYAATKPSLGDKAKKTLPKLGARLLKAGGVVAPAMDALGAGGAGTIASGAMEWLSGLIEDGDSVEKLHSELAAALSDQKKRFIVLIDDIDRLAPDEALAMFRLVKSVGRLPNVIYVLAFDRILAERVVAERFPSEGPHYLEKIVQASFELPTPNDGQLQQHLLTKIVEIAGEPEERLVVHVMNLFHEVVAPEIRTPRDSVRYINAFSVTWPAVTGEVDLGDFIALEAYRLFRPTIYQAIRANRDLVCGSSSGYGERKIPHEELDALLLPGIDDVARFRRGLMRLFPRLESIWSNVFHSRDAQSVRQRRACVSEHFPTYFQLSLPDNVISHIELQALIDHADNPTWIADTLRRSVQTQRRDGGTRASTLLDALRTHATDIPVDRCTTLLSGIFAVADDLDVEADQARGFHIGDNSLRIHWLLRALLRDRTDLTTRSKVLMSAAKNASLGWLVDLASSAWADYHPREGKEREEEENCLLTEQDAERMRRLVLQKIRQSAKDGSLLRHSDPASLLYRWRDFAQDEGRAVKRWTTARLKEDNAIVHFAAAFTSYSWTQGMGFAGLGDLVAKRSDRAQVSGLDSIIDKNRFRTRARIVETKLEEGSSERQTVERFLSAWDKQDRAPD
jgi:predicted KAP-like P-loop ATPase